MKRKVASIIAVALFIILQMVTACTNDKLDGTYVTHETILTQTVRFNGDKISISALGINASGTYTINGNTLTVTYDMFGNEIVETMSFKKDGSSVFLNGAEFIKQS